MRLTVKTNLAMRALMCCAVNPGLTIRKSDIAQVCHGSEAHLGIVVNQLAQAGLLETARGRGGGIRLARPPQDITVGEVFRLFEAGLPFTECFDMVNNHCPISCACRLKGVLGRALSAFYAELDRTTLADLTAGNAQLEGLLELA